MDRLSTENRNWFKKNLIPLILGVLAGGIAGWFAKAIVTAFSG